MPLKHLNETTENPNSAKRERLKKMKTPDFIEPMAATGLYLSQSKITQP